MASTGVWAGRLADWTAEDVRIAGNGWDGYGDGVGTGEVTKRQPGNEK